MNLLGHKNTHMEAEFSEMGTEAYAVILHCS